MSAIRLCRPDETAQILGIIVSAAEAYRGVIPDDCWHDPYMSIDDLEREIAAGVVFWGHEDAGDLTGVMGIQHVLDVDLIRHAYVLPASQSRGVGGRLLAHLAQIATRPVLVGTWAAAEWAVRFYQRHGFELVPDALKGSLLRTYWMIPERQIESSVVLSRSAISTPER